MSSRSFSQATVAASSETSVTVLLGASWSGADHRLHRRCLSREPGPWWLGLGGTRGTIRERLRRPYDQPAHGDHGGLRGGAGPPGAPRGPQRLHLRRELLPPGLVEGLVAAGLAEREEGAGRQ